MKKLFAILVMASMLLALCSCNNAAAENESSGAAGETLSGSTETFDVTYPDGVTAVSPEKLEKRIYSFIKETTTYYPALTVADSKPGAPAINCIEIDFEKNVFNNYGECILGDCLRDFLKDNPQENSDEWFEHPIYYKDKDYYPWIDGVNSSFTFETDDKYINIEKGGLVLEVLSDGSLIVVSSRGLAEVGTILS